MRSFTGEIYFILFYTSVRKLCLMFINFLQLLLFLLWALHNLLLSLFQKLRRKSAETFSQMKLLRFTFSSQVFFLLSLSQFRSIDPNRTEHCCPLNYSFLCLIYVFFYFIFADVNRTNFTENFTQTFFSSFLTNIFHISDLFDNSFIWAFSKFQNFFLMLIHL